MPEQFNMPEIMGKVEERTPYVIVCFQVYYIHCIIFFKKGQLCSKVAQQVQASKIFTILQVQLLEGNVNKLFDITFFLTYMPFKNFY